MSTVMASSRKICAAIWWPASSGVPTRAAAAVAMASVASRKPVRCTMWAPTLTTCHITDGTTARWWSPSARNRGIDDGEEHERR